MSAFLLAWSLIHAIIATCSASSPSQDPTCSSIGAAPAQKSSALLQVGRATYSDVLRPSELITGNDVELTADGYDKVVKLCCAKEMVDFMKRLVVSKHLQICASGGLPGLALFHDCPEDRNSFEGLLEDFETGQNGECPFLAKCREDDQDGECTVTCPKLAESCGKWPSATLPPCGDQTTPASTPDKSFPVNEPPSTPEAPTTPTPSAEPAPATPPTTFKTPTPSAGPAPAAPAPSMAPGTCCKQKTLLLNTVAVQAHRKTPAGIISKVKQFDCVQYPGAIQVIKEKKKGENQGGYDVKQLEIGTGKYNLAYHIPFTRTNPAFKHLNGVAINPIDGIAYGVLSFGDKKKEAYLVRFDDVIIEFVARVKSFSIVGAFSSYGDYYYIANGLKVARQVGSMEGFSVHTDVGEADFSNEPAIAEPGAAVADIVAYTGNLEGTPIPYVYIIALDLDKKDEKSDKLLVVKDAGLETQKWLLTTTKTGESKGFGAAWNFNGRVYFAGNSGKGVYEIPIATMNVNAGSVMMKKVGDSEKTSQNDGMNCMAIESPFPPPTEDGCGIDYEEVPTENDGSCPDGSFRA